MNPLLSSFVVRRCRTLPVIVFGWMLITLHGNAEPSRYSFKQITVEQGLSQNSVYAILQDRRGFLWFGTKDGLNRYDGYTFTIFKHDQNDSTSLADNFVTVLHEDAMGRIWVGTQNGGLHVFDRLHEKFVRIPFFLQFEIGSLVCNINAIAEDDSGTIWAGTNGLGLLRIIERDDLPMTDVQRFAVSVFRPGALGTHALGHERINALFFDRGKTLWVSSFGTLQSIDPYAADPKFTDYTLPRTPGDMNVLSFNRDSRQRLWLGTSAGLYRYDDEKKYFLFYPITMPGITVPNRAIRTICEDEQGMLWLGTFAKTLLFNPETGHYASGDEQSDVSMISGVIFIYRDKSGAMWFGSNGEGLYIHNPNIIRFQSFTQKTKPVKDWESRSVRALFEDFSGRLWIGSYGGLYVLDKDRKAFHHVKEIVGLPIRRILQDKEGNIWVAALDGLVKQDGRGSITGRFKISSDDSTSLPSPMVAGIFEDRSGTIWAVTPGVLNELNNKSNRWTRYTMYEREIESNDPIPVTMLQDSLDNIWLTSERGLWRFDVRKKSFAHYAKNISGKNGLSYNVTLSLCPDPLEPHKFLWIGTAGGGLNRFEFATQEFISFTEKEGLPNDVIYGILSDAAGNLWLSTNKGIAKFNPRTGAVRTFVQMDGLQSNEYNSGAYFKNARGEIFFGGINGFDIFDPKELRDNSYVPPVVITGMQLFGNPVTIADWTGILTQAVSETQSVTLSYHQNVFSLTFASLDFTIPEKNMYRYELEGFDREYVDAETKRTATYTNLDPGTYIFRVQGSNNDGVWNAQGASLTIVVLPPYWMTWWFRSIVVLAFLSAGPFIYWRRVSTLKKEKSQQESFTRKLIEQEENERKRIAVDLHDTLGQQLLVIKNRADIALSIDRMDPKEQLSHISTIAAESLKEVRQIAHNLRPYELDRAGLTDTIKGMIRKVADSSTIKFSVEIDDIDGLLAKEGEVNLFRIVQEGLNNIMKHAQAAEVRISAERADRKIKLSISDDGKGFVVKEEGTSPKIRRGLGLSGITERTHMLNGTCSVQSQPGKGTSIQITIPIAAPSAKGAS